ncbi:MAG: hypothetical protein GY805_08610 [Chloroflexi bacterium]|nr:hypothetical protein [Chloroflexota bacterium]
MNELGIVVALAHLNQASFGEVLEISQASVVLSHRSSRMIRPFKRVNSRKMRCTCKVHRIGFVYGRKCFLKKSVIVL